MFLLNVSFVDAALPPYVLPAVIMIILFVMVFWRFCDEFILKM